MAARVIVMKEEPADQVGQRQGDPHEQPAARGSRPAQAGRVTRLTTSASVPPGALVLILQ